MKPEDFETRLKRQPMRKVPSEWREQILSAARKAGQASPAPSLSSQAPWLSTLSSQLSTFLWPHPRAWAGLAAVWLVILAINFSTGEKSTVVARRALASPEVIITWKEQQRLLAELIGPPEIPAADRPKSAPPRPRSERYNETSRV